MSVLIVVHMVRMSRVNVPPHGRSSRYCTASTLCIHLRITTLCPIDIWHVSLTQCLRIAKRLLQHPVRNLTVYTLQIIAMPYIGLYPGLVIRNSQYSQADLT